MKTIITILFFIFSIPVYGEQPSLIRLNHESDGNEQASGFAFIFDESTEEQLFYSHIGISFNSIKSNQPIEHSGRREIYPVYIFFNFSLKQTVTPFFEFGIDIGDALLDEIKSGDSDEIDHFYSLGLKLIMDKTVSISIYHKEYNFRFNET